MDFARLWPAITPQLTSQSVVGGYLAQVGWTNINVRIFLAKGKLPHLDRIVEAYAKAGIKLHRNYGEMMDKLTLSYEGRR